MDWFICLDEKVEGPYTGDAVRSLIEGGQLTDKYLVWGRGQSEWITTQRWLQMLDQAVAAEQARPFSQSWHYAVNGESKGPFTRAELLHELRGVRDKDQILVWTKGMNAWADLFDFHDLVDELSLERRGSPRVEIQGTITAKNESERTATGQLRVIGVGGCGADGLSGLLQVGDHIHVEIKSDVLANPITTNAQVQYITEAGYVGIKFDGLNMESKSLIQQYIRQKSQASDPDAAAA